LFDGVDQVVFTDLTPAFCFGGTVGVSVVSQSERRTKTITNTTTSFVSVSKIVLLYTTAINVAIHAL